MGAGRTGDPGPDLQADLLVIGSGIAGLTAALHAASWAHVLLVTKGELADGSTRYAQGGIAGAVHPADSAAEHAQDTLLAGAGLGAPDAVRVLCEEASAAIGDLIERGVEFDRIRGLEGGHDGGGEGGAGTARAPYALGLEGAHSRPRILHAGGDATGWAIEEALVAAVRARAAEELGGTAHGSLTMVEHTALVDLLVEGGRVVGAELVAAGGARSMVRARATLLATGGAGQLFAHTTNPAVATGDGTAAAWRAGAALEDLEFFQFHPTALAAPGSFLISEAVRGEGATLRDERGARFLPALDPRAELAPRDVVARAIAQVMEDQQGRPVLLDATSIGAERLRARFPTIDAAVRAAGFDWGREPVPVTPAAHYWMGGIRTDLEGRTTLPGLFAAGECARTGVHGANRLASNSLLEGAVFGARAGEAATAAPRAPAAAPVVPAGAPASMTCAGAPRISAGAWGVGTAAGEPWTRAALQDLLWNHAGLLRTGEQLEAAAAQLDAWTIPDPAALSTMREVEDRNLLDLARLLIAHALERPASVGAHHRLDAPASDAPAAPAAPAPSAAPAAPAGPGVPAAAVAPVPSAAPVPAQEALAC